jgi:hypothetical protein
MSDEVAVRRGGSEVAVPTEPDDCSAFYRWEPVIMGDKRSSRPIGVCDMSEEIQRRFAESGQLQRCVDEITPLLSDADDEDRMRFMTRLMRTCYRAGGGEKEEYLSQMYSMVERLNPCRGILGFALDKLFEDSEGWLHPPRAVKDAIKDGDKRFTNLVREINRLLRTTQVLPSVASSGPGDSPGS